MEEKFNEQFAKFMKNNQQIHIPNSKKYENMVTPVPEPSGWFHATVRVEYPVVKVFVNNSGNPSLTIEQLSNRKNGWVGFWVGNNSEGWFKNLKITSK